MRTEFTFYYIRQRGYVCMLVFSAGLNKNYRTHSHKTWMDDGCQPRIEPITFWYTERVFKHFCSNSNSEFVYLQYK